MIGLSWLGELSMLSAPPELISQTQPLPNRPAPAAANCSLNVSNDPNAASIALDTLPVGAPPPFALITCQNIVWFECPPPLLRTAVRIAAGTLSRSAMSSSRPFAASSGCPSSAPLSLVT